MNFQDINKSVPVLSGQQLICKDCGAEFIFSAKEQVFFEDHGLLPPKRCLECRRIRKQNSARLKNKYGYGKRS